MKMKSILMGSLAIVCACAFGGENSTEKTRKAMIDGYIWSYRIQNGEATIIAEKDGQFFCAVSPGPIGHLTIPAAIDGAKVTRIGRDAFAHCGILKSIIIPDGVTCIDRGAFYECGMLKSVKIPLSVSYIGMDAFNRCAGLTEISIPSGVTSVGRDAFAGCGSLKQVTIPSSLEHIEWGMFGNCVGLEAVTILPGVRSIGQWAFVNCDSLTEVTIPSGVCSIDNGAFRYCNSIRTVSIPSSVTNIHGAAFCESGTLMSFRVAEDNPVYKSDNGMLLTKDGTTLVHGVNGHVVIPSTVTTIGPCAFEGSVALRSVAIPSGVKSIGEYAFKQCRGMTSVTIPPSVTNIAFQAFDNCTGLNTLTLPATLTNIDRTAFNGCTNLKSVNVVKDGKTETVTFEEFIKRQEIASPARPGTLRERRIAKLLERQNAAAKEKDDKPAAEKIAVAQKLQECDFLLNKDFKKNAKYYLCLFSASWCGPCRREMPRIAKTYVDTLKDNPDIELVHFSCDRDDDKAMAWAKEHDVKFPVVKPQGGNPLNLQSRGIPHLFIVKADGTLLEEGHPAMIFTQEKLQSLK